MSLCLLHDEILKYSKVQAECPQTTGSRGAQQYEAEGDSVATNVRASSSYKAGFPALMQEPADTSAAGPQRAQWEEGPDQPATLAGQSQPDTVKGRCSCCWQPIRLSREKGKSWATKIRSISCPEPDSSFAFGLLFCIATQYMSSHRLLLAGHVWDQSGCKGVGGLQAAVLCHALLMT